MLASHAVMVHGWNGIEQCSYCLFTGTWFTQVKNFQSRLKQLLNDGCFTGKHGFMRYDDEFKHCSYKYS